MINGNCFFERILEKFKYIPSLLRRGLFVLWGGFCVVRRLGRKKKRARGARWEWGSSHRPPRAFYFFDYWYFDGDTQREPLRRREIYIPEIRYKFCVDLCIVNLTCWHLQCKLLTMHPYILAFAKGLQTILKFLKGRYRRLLVFS